MCRRTVEDAKKKKKRHQALDAAGQDGVARIDRYAATMAAYAPTAANKRSVWTVSSRGYEGAHFATFTEELIIPTIKAGSSEKGCCAKCKAPWKRVVTEPIGGTIGKGSWTGALDTSVVGVSRTPLKNQTNQDDYRPSKTVGWEPTCECHGKFVKKKKVMGFGLYHDHSQDGVEMGLRQGGKGPAAVVGEPTKEFERIVDVYVPNIPLEEHPVIPCTVLDPFMGSGTTAAVSLSLGRRSVGIDLSQVYLENNAIPRIEGEAAKRPSLNNLISREVKKMTLGTSVKKS